MRLGLKIPQPGSRPFDVAGVGLNSIDLLAVVAEYPASNSKQRLQRFMHMPGGQIGTALTACARLGLNATYVGWFGSDPLGAMSLCPTAVMGNAHTRDAATILLDRLCG